jgi:tetratricopeptide (TPR) repeat protein
LPTNREPVATIVGILFFSSSSLYDKPLTNNRFWGVFWVDVSSVTSAETGFLTMAKIIHAAAENLEEARQALSNIQQPWLLILDNADDCHFDYQAYLPTGNYGVVLMTSRNSECRRYATVLHDALALEGLDDSAARELLLRSANIPPDNHASHEGDARMVFTLLGLHPLAIIQAGSYVACGHCTLYEYPQHYQRHRQRLLKFRPTQEQSRYGHVYATFEASTEVLQSSSDEAAQDALQVLSMFSMLGCSPLPLAIFEAAWRGAQEIAMTTVDDDYIDIPSPWHVKQLISLVEVDADEWDSFRVTEAIHLLTSLSLITANNKDGQASISMHPLTHAWAKDRQERRAQDQSWIATGSMIALSKSNDILWRSYERQLRPHLHAYLDREMSEMFGCGPQLMVVRIVFSCGLLLNQMRDDSRLFSLMNGLFSKLSLNSGTARKEWVSLYNLAGRNLHNYGRVKEAVSLLEEVVKIQEQTLAAEHPDRLTSQHELAGAYQANGQVKEAVSLLEEVVKIREQIQAAEHPDRLASQHELARAYQTNGQVKEAVSLLEEVVKIEEQTLAAEHSDRLASQHELAGAYLTNGQIKEAVSMLEKVVKIQKQIQAAEHPDRLTSQHELAGAYQANGQVKEAVSLLEKVVKIREQTQAAEHPHRLASQHELARAYQANGQVKEAVSLLEEVVKIREQTQAAEHPHRLASQHELARSYQANGQVKKAVSLLEEVVKIREQTLTAEHPDRLASQHELARAYQANGQVKEAVSLLEEVVKIREQTQAAEHPDRLTSQHALALALWDNYQRKEAVSLMESVVKHRQRVLRPDHPSRLVSEEELAWFYQELSLQTP